MIVSHSPLKIYLILIDERGLLAKNLATVRLQDVT